MQSVNSYDSHISNTIGKSIYVVLSGWEKVQNNDEHSRKSEIFIH